MLVDEGIEVGDDVGLVDEEGLLDEGAGEEEGLTTTLVVQEAGSPHHELGTIL